MNTKNLKPFDLEVALRGEPVMLRDGRKAFVRHHETELPIIAHSCIWGAVANESGEYAELKAWSKNGRYVEETLEHSKDIIGMYPKTRIINGFEVPAPEAVEPECGNYYLVCIDRARFYESHVWDNDEADRLWLERGLIFLSIEDAIANAKAMLGIDPYAESEE